MAIEADLPISVQLRVAAARQMVAEGQFVKMVSDMIMSMKQKLSMLTECFWRHTVDGEVVGGTFQQQ